MDNAVDSRGGRLGWVDSLRVLACFLVVMAHCCDGFVGAFDTDRSAFLSGAFLGSLARPSVPLFVAMTAVLLLPIPSGVTMGAFYRRRIGRVAVPLLFWSVALPVMFYLYYGVVNPGSTNPMVDVGAYTGAELWRKVWLMVFNFNFDTVPLWYLYMLVGLYLVMPVVNAWLVQATRRDLRLFLSLWGVTLFLPYMKLLAPHVGYTGNFGSMEILGACDWNAYGTLYYLSGFIGYMVLAYYLGSYPLRWSAAKKWAVLGPMFVGGFAVTFFGFVRIQDFFPGDYSFLEVIWYFTGINVFMMTLPVMVAAQSFDGAAPAWIGRLAKLSFGIYLCHFFFVYLYFEVFAIDGWHPLMRIAAMTLATFATAALLTQLLSLWPPTRRLVA